MIIELKGIATNNKGAHLMLLSILEEFSKRKKSETFCTVPRPGMEYKSAGLHNILLKENFRGRKIPWTTVMGLLSKKIRRNYGLILDSEISVILDGSGFAYGDFWGANKVHSRLGNFLDGKTGSKSRLILLPQAFGPFDKPKVKDAFEKVVDKATLIFARDEVSYNHLVSNYGERDNIKQAPDFTNLLDSGESVIYPEGNICIIPNYKMIPKEDDRKSYYIFLKEVVEYIKNNGKLPYFLIHEGERDKKIAEDINEMLDFPIQIVEPFDAVEIKNRIKSADLIIVSRFHGLVSALSQGVPAITTSWSHKYKELVKDYDQQKVLVDIHDFNKKEIFELIDTFLNNGRDSYLNSQKDKIAFQKTRSEEMWNHVFNVMYV